MQVNEVVVNGVTELSLVNDTVSEDTLLENVTTHDASGKQITGKFVPYNPNLLDNWYFAVPINQRGQTEYTGRGYTIDRWFKNAANTVRIIDNGVQLVESGSLIRQRIATDLENFLIDKTVTLTVLLSSGNLFTVSTIFPNKAGTSFEVQGNITMSFYWDDEYQNVVFTAQEASVTIEAVKLELGSIQTLAHKDTDGNWVLNDPPPNPALELAKCQWYYRRVEQARIRAWGYTTNSIPFFVPYPEMRIRPTATIKGSPTISSMATTAYADFSCSVDWTTTTGCKITALKTAHGLTDGLLHINSDLGVYIELSADL